MMQNSFPLLRQESPSRSRRGTLLQIRPSQRSPVMLLLAVLLVVPGAGCAALTNPLVQAVPVRRLPEELLTPAKEPEATTPLACLRQRPPDVYHLEAGDVLGVWIDGVLGERTVTLPLHVAPATQSQDQRRLPPAAGYPVPVRKDGTVILPLVDPVRVKGLSLAEAEDAIREQYTVKKQILKAGNERIMVTLLHARQYHVLVLRQESAAFLPGPNGTLANSSKRGTGHVVDLPAYENDVLHAMARTGGLPGLDAFNEVVIFRGCFQDSGERALLLQQLESSRTAGSPSELKCQAVRGVLRIPLRQCAGEAFPFHPDDVILQSGDVVFIESRDAEVFYAGGLLPPGQYALPRDRDLDVLQAVTLIQGPLLNAGFNTSNLSGNLIQAGVGNPSPSLLIVLRRLPGGGQIPIRVDLNRALADARERIRVQAGDVLLLQETPGEAFARYISQTMLNFSLAWQVIHERFATGVIDVTAPQPALGRIGLTNFIP